MRPWKPGRTNLTSLRGYPISSVHAEKSSDKAKIKILNPHDSDRFIMSSHLPNRIVFRALPESVVDHVTWLLDGFEIARTAAPYELVWELSRGRHVLHAVTPINEAAQVTFSVE
jgi:membrane carboxypeptidase/penicillin-binding protein PbpC